jgi:hypothetical protein
MRFFACVFGLAALLLAPLAALSQEAPKTEISEPEELANALERLSADAPTIDAFGEAINRAALRAAATEFREGRSKDGRARVSMTLTVRVLPLPVPKPGEIDLCYETCAIAGAFFSCYAACKAAIPPLGGSQKQLCIVLENAYQSAVRGANKFLAACHLVRAGCAEANRFSVTEN